MKKAHNIKTTPDWVPDNAGTEFTTSVMPGVVGGHDGMSGNKINHSRIAEGKQKASLSVDDMYSGIIAGNRSILARAITLIESNSPKHIEKAQQLLKLLLPKTGKSIRVGITGSPGAGKSTFIESLGSYLCELGNKVAVLAIDPSSTRSKGSILGDKTRMEKLSRLENAFIRPSPSSGTLGGVARKTRETILLCEAAGFDIILIETVGVGQSEVTVRSMVDFFMLMILPGGGDELQGIKKGSVELADALVINKSDGENLQIANITKSNYEIAVHYILPATEGWQTRVTTCSALNDTGIAEIWQIIEEFISTTKNSGIFETRRKEQVLEWVYSMVEENLKQQFYTHPMITNALPAIEKSVLHGTLTPTSAFHQLMEIFAK